MKELQLGEKLFTCPPVPGVPRHDRARAMPICVRQSVESRKSHTCGEAAALPCAGRLVAPQGTVPEPLLPAQRHEPDQATGKRGQTPRGASDCSPTGAGASRPEIARAQASHRGGRPEYAAEP